MRLSMIPDFLDETLRTLRIFFWITQWNTEPLSFFPFSVWVAGYLTERESVSWILVYFDGIFLLEKIWQSNIWLTSQGNYPLNLLPRYFLAEMNPNISLDSPSKILRRQNHEDSSIWQGISFAAPWPRNLPHPFNDFLLRVWWWGSLVNGPSTTYVRVFQFSVGPFCCIPLFFEPFVLL